MMKRIPPLQQLSLMSRRQFTLGAGAAVAASTMASGATGMTPSRASNVVLVHGAYADGSSWSEVIPLLLDAGLRVTSVQNPLTSFADDVAAVRRAVALQEGPTVLVGHSYGGMIVSEVGMDPKISALVFVAARAPDAGEDYPALAKKFPPAPATAGLTQAAGYAQLSETAFLRDFANGLSPARARTLYAVQQPIAETLFNARTTAAAWRGKQSFYAISKRDRTIAPELERFLAARVKATTIELDAGHLSLISHPYEVARLILAAADRR